MNQNLNEQLDAFRAEMFAKFKAVEHKHRGASVTDDNIDWLTFDWEQIEQHFIEEFAEYFNLTKDEIDQLIGLIYRSENYNDPRKTKEAVDAANMSFLMWWYGENKK
ncbi:MAG: hypothetical protein UT24_C0003G0069 [Candidatus Woesebacteria bacterium GW2011_GWB1_39_12]|uniref:Uncharacterized protein n=1 Tax=Candidatus Woesebacteria bacterium GW2011_GWB1_39_12 TaxID=1618574 RepID=A0A0G0QIZ9_9BACT|nr:MAG: hypothetical protein UT24_C0003G0069 [Candidatus Woesebacteria bacterium GW2011_GWB1_39_12]